jgi:hypothetical protein
MLVRRTCKVQSGHKFSANSDVISFMDVQLYINIKLSMTDCFSLTTVLRVNELRVVL